MNKIFSVKKLIYGLAVLAVFQSCKKDDDPVPAPEPVPDQSFTQGFNTTAEAVNQGWIFKNRSDEAATGWRVRAKTIFYEDVPFEGAGLLYSNYEASGGFDGNISDWAISPARIIQNGDKISFYALSSGSHDGYADRLQLRLNTFNTSDSIGENSTDVGNFTKPLVDINPVYKVTGPGDFPTVWTKYEATVTGLNKPDSGRFALRYFVEILGGANGDELAV
ncbi:MAG: choice-of-anchor J domain-containing protein, partial [Chitinophagaceae bacterium]